MRFSLGSEGERLMLLIQDTGPGIPPGLQQQVFEPFFSTAIMGNGMGLFIAKELCEINQAHLDVYEVSEGCCFGILFHAQPGVTV